MKTYHKIQTVFKRDPETKYKTLIEGDYSIPEFEYLKDNKWVFTEKVDGTNIRIQWKEQKIYFAGKTDKAQFYGDHEKILKEMFLPLENDFNIIFGNTNACLYGEGYGAGIQKGGNYRSDKSFVLFDIKIGDWWLKRDDLEEITEKLNIDIVPIIGEGTLLEMVEMTRNGFNSIWGDFIAEGIVARPKVELKSRNGKRLITKIKYKDFE